MATYCRHGEGLVVLTTRSAEPDLNVLVYVRDGVIVSAEINLATTEREIIEERLAEHPPRLGRITARQVQASLRVPFDEESDKSDGTLGSEDTDTDAEEDDYEDEDED